MPWRQTLPNLWLISDQRNDAVLEEALARLPNESGFVFRHYHLEPAPRRERFGQLAFACRRAGHLVVLSADADTAVEWDADGVYGPPAKLSQRTGLLRFAAVHGTKEIRLADRAEVDAMFLSPVYPTRSHPDGRYLGKNRFLTLASLAKAPVIALGGLNAERAADLGWPRWAAIDGLS
jgi:thiamine-phosphate pyrophosphorylase